MLVISDFVKRLDFSLYLCTHSSKDKDNAQYNAQHEANTQQMFAMDFLLICKHLLLDLSSLKNEKNNGVCLVYLMFLAWCLVHRTQLIKICPMNEHLCY